jgi:hypothetical protein
MTKIRNRMRPAGTLRERLLAMAHLARRKADELPEGSDRAKLLEKADQSERTAAIESWITSKGLKPPE